ERFGAMRLLLEDLSSSLDPQFFKMHIGEHVAFVEIGMPGPAKSFDTEVRWQIEPNCKLQFNTASEETDYEEEPGFKVEQTSFPAFEPIEKHMVFETEAQTLEYLAHKIGEKIAFYLHTTSKG